MKESKKEETAVVVKSTERLPDEKVFNMPATYQGKTHKLGDPIPEEMLKDKRFAYLIGLWGEVRPKVEHLTLTEENKALKGKILMLEKQIAELKGAK